jgi:hypothetical protein
VERWEEEEGIEITVLKKKIQYRIQWEMKKNGYPVPDFNKTMIKCN